MCFLRWVKVVECVICGDEVDGGNSGWCHRCERFAPHLVGVDHIARPSREARSEVNELLRPDRGRSNKTRWRRVINHYPESESDWAFRDDQPSRLPPSPWCNDEDEWMRQVEEHESVFRVRGDPDPADRARVLQRGITLSDGSHLSCISKVWALNGEILDGPIPFKHLLMSLRPRSGERVMTEGCDWPKLLKTLFVPTSISATAGMPHINRIGEVRRMQRLFLRRLHGPPNHPLNGLTLFTKWLRLCHTIPLGDVGRHEFNDGRHERVFAEMVREFTVVDWDELEKSGGPWVPRWREVSERPDMRNSLQSWAGSILRVNRDRLQFRVIKNGGWTWLSLPPWPKLWALLVNWSLSPPSSPEHQRIRALQWNWFSIDGVILPEDSERRALVLLRSICESNERLTLGDDDDSTIYIEGTSGLFYSVRPGPGAHGARFSVRGARSITDLQNGEGRKLCIREDPEFTQLPAGDVVASVLLTLMDDLVLSERLKPLSAFIHMNMRGQVRNLGAVEGFEEPGWLIDQRHRFHLGRQRWLTLYPTIYRILTKLRMGSRVFIPRQILQEGRIEDTLVRWDVESESERELTEGLARLAGFREVEDERGGHEQVMERVEVPVEGVRRRLVELLGPFERRYGRAGEPPWWNIFPDPIPQQDLPEELPADLNRPLDDPFFI